MEFRKWWPICFDTDANSRWLETNLMPWQPISRFPFLSDSLCTSGIDILCHLELCLTVSSALVSASVSTSIVQSFKSSCRKQVNKHQTYALSCSCHYDKVKKTYIFFIKTKQIIWLSTRTSTVKLYSRLGELFCYVVSFQEITLIKGLNLSDHAESYISHMETTGKQFMCHDPHRYWAVLILLTQIYKSKKIQRERSDNMQSKL